MPEWLKDVISILPLFVLLLGLIQYALLEYQKQKDRKHFQLQELRNQIQGSNEIVEIIYQCQSKKLPQFFFESSDSEYNKALYKAVVKTIGLYDSMCYSFINGNLNKRVFVYFWGEMFDVFQNEAIQKFLDSLLQHNLKYIVHSKPKETDLFDAVLPYGFFQLTMRIDPVSANRFSHRRFRKAILTLKKQYNHTLMSQYLSTI